MKVTRVGEQLLLVVSEQEARDIKNGLDGVKRTLLYGIPEARHQSVIDTLALAINIGPSLPRFKDFTRDLEALLLTEAMKADRNLTRAAAALGFNHHQSLISLLNSRHKRPARVCRPCSRESAPPTVAQ